jgi:hypothetical protein
MCLLFAGSVASQALNETQKAVWQTVEARWEAWRVGDIDRMVSFYEPQYRRWNARRVKLDSRDDLAAGFRNSKGFERPVSVTFESIVIDVFDDAAIVHYISHEIVAFTEDAPMVKAKKVKAGENVEWPIRWSEYLVKKKGKWRLAGGSRDGTCAMFKPSDNVCR